MPGKKKKVFVSSAKKHVHTKPSKKRQQLSPTTRRAFNLPGGDRHPRIPPRGSAYAIPSKTAMPHDTVLPPV